MVAKSVTDPAVVLFPVEERPVFLGPDDEQLDGPLFSQQGGRTAFSQIPGLRAIVDVERRRVFSVVGPQYRLVTNREALDLGQACFCQVLGQTTAEGLAVFNIIMPQTRSFCHVDYTREGLGFDAVGRGDRWIPFLRVTNSYNRTQPLRFQVGFCRWICTNGMIFGGKSIRLKYAHTKGEVHGKRFLTDFKALGELQARFVLQLQGLESVPVPKEQMLGIACRVFNVTATPVDLQRPRRGDQLRAFRSRIEDLTASYFGDLGPNAYAALNVLTDFASRPASYTSPGLMVDSLQRKTGEWAVSFRKESREPGFSFPEYLGDAMRVAEVLSS